MTVLERVHIPPEALKVKANYWGMPDEEAITREIREWVAANGTPYTWPGHTHTKPFGPPIQILGEFGIPKERRKDRQLWSPCPCCSPDMPKFKDGLIAWFPEEGVIRLIGKDCFRTISDQADEALTAAMDDYERRKKIRRDLDYLLKNAERVSVMLAWIGQVMPIATAMDGAAEQLRARFNARLQISLETEVRDGALYIIEKGVQRTYEREGNIYERDVDTRQRYAGLAGYRLLSVKGSRGQWLQALQERLEEIAAWLGGVNDLESYSAEERHATALALGRASRRGQELNEELLDCRRFFVEGLATLAAWGAHPKNPRGFVMEIDGGVVRAGVEAPDRLELRMPVEATYSIPSFPAI